MNIVYLREKINMCHMLLHEIEDDPFDVTYSLLKTFEYCLGYDSMSLGTKIALYNIWVGDGYNTYREINEKLKQIKWEDIKTILIDHQEGDDLKTFKKIENIFLH